MLDIASDGSVMVVDSSTDAAFLNLAWAEDATHFSYGTTPVLATRTRGRLGVRQGSDRHRAVVVAEVADPLIAVGGLAFAPTAADGACALLPGARVVLGRERRFTLRDDTRNSRRAADPGPDLTVIPPQVVTLDGRGSCDADGEALTPHWELIAAPAGSAWSLEDAETWTPHLFADRIGPYRVGLTVTDQAGAVSRPADVLVRAGNLCHDGLDNDLDGLFDTDDPDCDASNDHPIVDRFDPTTRELRVGRVTRDDLTVRIASGAYPLTFQSASTDPSAATAVMEGGTLEIHANRPGAARVIVTADDGHGQRTFDVIDVRVAGSPACVGDCDADGVVTVDELLTGVAIALGTAPFERCPALDGDTDGDVAIAEILTAVRHALAGCS